MVCCTHTEAKSWARAASAPLRIRPPEIDLVAEIEARLAEEEVLQLIQLGIELSRPANEARVRRADRRVDGGIEKGLDHDHLRPRVQDATGGNAHVVILGERRPDQRDQLRVLEDRPPLEVAERSDVGRPLRRATAECGRDRVVGPAIVGTDEAPAQSQG
jgi:hypothetical protein